MTSADATDPAYQSTTAPGAARIGTGALTTSADATDPAYQRFTKLAASRQPRIEPGVTMNTLSTIALIALLVAVPPARAQHGDSAALPAYSAPAEAHQFDFLIGQWTLEVIPKVGGLVAMIHGAPRLVGSWKAWPAFDGFGIEDELRVMDASGNPATLSHALRVYDSNKGQWTIAGMDVYRALTSQASAEWRDGEMHVKGAGTQRDGTRYLSRTRFYDIGAEGFRMQQDRSTDGGETWEEASLAIVATKVAATAPR